MKNYSKPWRGFIGGFILLSGCDSTVYVGPDGKEIPKEVAEAAQNLPSQATNIELVGNGWVTFDYQGFRFLYRSYGNPAASNYTETIAYFPKPLAEKQ